MIVSRRRKKLFYSARARRRDSAIKRFTRDLLLALNILLVLLLLLSYLSVYINPATNPLPALFGLAYPYIAAANLLMVGIWTASMRWYALISAVALVAGFSHINNFIRFAGHSGAEPQHLKFMSYNIRYFNYYETDESDSYGKMTALLRKEDPDILCLQEYFVRGDPAAGERKLKERMGGRRHTHFKLVKSGNSIRYGIATISRYPVIARGDIIHPGTASLTIYTDIVVESDTFRVYNNHLQSFHLNAIEGNIFNEIADEQKRGVAMKKVKTIYRSLMRGFSSRALQVDRVRRHIETSPYPVIVAGDFNDTPVSYTYRIMRRGLRDAFVDAGYGAGFTYRGNYPANRIDYILYGDCFECTDFDVLRVKYSDHYPIVATFRQREQTDQAGQNDQASQTSQTEGSKDRRSRRRQ